LNKYSNINIKCYRCLRRNKVSKPSLKDSEEKTGIFEEVKECGFIHIDVKYLTKLDGKRSYVYVAIDRATRYVYLEVLYDLKQETTKEFVTRFKQHFPYPIKVILTDNGFEFTDKLSGETRKAPTGKHLLDIFCKENNIEHRLTRPRTPRTNGMVERFNRRINEAIARKDKISKNNGKNTFNNHKERNKFVIEFARNYNRTRLRCLGYRSPVEMLDNHAGQNTKAGIQ